VILLDTSVLSAALRRQTAGGAEARVAQRLQELLGGTEKLHVPGLVVQELLTGIREERQVHRIRTLLLEGYAIVLAAVGDHVLAADIVNKCRRKGIAVSSGDALIAALAMNRNATLFTTDQDFEHIARCVTLRLLAE
jgi:predicted nucleic acid-binding protein